MTSPKEDFPTDEVLKNPWDYIQIPILERNDPGQVGVRREEIRLISAVASLVNLISPKPEEVHTISATDFMEQLKRVIPLLHTQPDNVQQPQQIALNIYRNHLEGAVGTVEVKGEVYLKTKALQDPAHPDVVRTPWENMIQTINTVSRALIQQETGINCFEKDENDRLKPIKVGGKPLW